MNAGAFLAVEEEEGELTRLWVQLYPLYDRVRDAGIGSGGRRSGSTDVLIGTIALYELCFRKVRYSC